MKALLPFLTLTGLCLAGPAGAATAVPFTVNASEAVTVNTAGGTPRLQLDVGGVTRYADYTAGSGSAALTFTYTTQPGDVDLDGITLSSPLQLNGGTIADASGNALSPLTFTVPATTGILVDHPSLAANFVTNDYILNGTHYNSLGSFLSAAGGSFSRNSVATYFDAAGTMQTVSANTPRFTYHPLTHAYEGLMLEENRINYVRNTAMSGAAAGTPGTLPTNWAILYNPAGYSTQVVGTGTENGMNYIDVRFYNNSSINEVQLGWELVTGIAPSQIWTNSLYAKQVGGSTAGLLEVRARMTWEQSGGAYVALSNSNFLPSLNTGSYYRASVTATAPALTGRVHGLLNIMPQALNTDITIRIAAPQLEQGPFPTSFIPTTGSQQTRQTERVTIPTGAWFSAANSSILAAGTVSSTTAANRYPAVWALNTGSFANELQYYVNIAPGSTHQMKSMVSSTPTYDTPYGSITIPGSFRTAIAADGAGGYASNNGAAVVTGTGALPTGINTLELGTASNGQNSLNGRLTNFRYYPSRVANPQLRLLSQ